MGTVKHSNVIAEVSVQQTASFATRKSAQKTQPDYGLFRKTKPSIPEAIQEVEAKHVGRCRSMAELKTRREN